MSFITIVLIVALAIVVLLYGPAVRRP